MRIKFKKQNNDGERKNKEFIIGFPPSNLLLAEGTFTEYGTTNYWQEM